MVDQVVSYAQNGEDIVLWRTLAHIEGGTYLDIGANHPSTDSVSRLFYEKGWSGVTVEPVADFVEQHREQRPRDTVVQVAISDGEPGEIELNVIDDSGLSTLDDDVARQHAVDGLAPHRVVVPTTSLDLLVAEHLPGREVHFCCIDVEGAEKAVLDSVDLTAFRPWVLVIEATAPNSTELRHSEWEPQVLAAGYEYCLFDGLSRFYVAAEHAEQLRDKLSYPACPHDHYVPLSEVNLTNEWHAANARITHLEAVLEKVEAREAAARQQLGGHDAIVKQLRSDLRYWRGQVIEHFARVAVAPQAAAPTAEDNAAQRELDAIRQTVSWKVTAPLRSVRRVFPGRA